MKRKSKSFFAISVISIFIWASLLVYTDSYFSVYILIGILSALALYHNHKHAKLASKTDYLLSALFALMVTASNYATFKGMFDIGGGVWHLIYILMLILSFTSGTIVFSHLIAFLRDFSIRTTPVANLAKKTGQKTKKTKVPRVLRAYQIFLICFFIFFVVDIIVFLICYPGTLTPDSMNEMEQILSNTYSNHHPVYFTLLIKLFVSGGMHLTGDINAGVAFYNIFQIIVMSAIFSYSIVTLYQIGVSKKILIPLAIILAILPYNFLYSFTIWKDVLFGGAFLVFTVALYRYFYKMDRSIILTTAIIIVSGVIICLFRSNALIAFLVSAILFFVVFRKSQIRFGIMLFLIAIFSFILKNPVLGAFNIPQADIVEPLAIPMQQITRVLVEKKSELSSEDLELISQIANPDRLAEVYTPYIHDPVKNLVRQEGDKQFISDHKIELALLYLRLGVRYPDLYTKAWIDQTRGYWNGGYSYWKWSNEVYENPYGITRAETPKSLNKLLKIYLGCFERTPFLTPLMSIGLAAWVTIVTCYISLKRKNKYTLFLAIPIILTWGTLLIATPVFSEFRYAYFLFTCVPFLTIATFATSSKNNKSSIIHNRS